MAVVFLLLLIVLVAVALAGFNRPVHHVRYVRRRPRPTTVVHEEIVERPRPPEVWEEIVEP